MTSLTTRLLATVLILLFAFPASPSADEETIEFLRLRALEDDPAKKGVNINIFIVPINE